MKAIAKIICAITLSIILIFTFQYKLPSVDAADSYESGDVNKDGTVDVSDASLIQKYTAQYDDIKNQFQSGVYSAKAADVSGDETISVTDSTRVQKIAASASVPTYWKQEISDTAQKIKDLQKQYGNDLLCFGWCSDMHIAARGTAHEKNLGAVAARVMNECDIPFFIMSGDMLTADSATTLESIPSAYNYAWSYLSPIGMEKIMAIRGNHDAWTGKVGDPPVYYVKGLPPEQVNALLFEPQRQDTRRVFGPDGSYFYLDYGTQKTRFICLNSHWAVYEENPDGTAKYSTQKQGGFGQEQLDWLISEALNVKEDYSVIITMHVPPSEKTQTSYRYDLRDFDIIQGIIKAYCNKTSYSGTYTHSHTEEYIYEGEWADVSVSCDFSDYNGNMLAILCGHSHRDQLVTGELPAPIVCITSSINTPYDADKKTRVLNTKNETVMDFVCVNRKTGKIDLIRCGYGNDRVIS